ncbi:hypothetical protein BDV24DRAFT_126744 [Aspergillus arachidicola]|uniref:Uncharacterized protein n=1 Tax=Aspergillus arachidicola TaxID=656916 RepID=A0A5N6YM37_9EURO|nr:hypothetical protein BDV24DRAFT_126744 [Aspergillus arachidicola]
MIYVLKLWGAWLLMLATICRRINIRALWAFSDSTKMKPILRTGTMMESAIFRSCTLIETYLSHEFSLHLQLPV